MFDSLHDSSEMVCMRRERKIIWIMKENARQYRTRKRDLIAIFSFDVCERSVHSARLGTTMDDCISAYVVARSECCISERFRFSNITIVNKVVPIDKSTWWIGKPFYWILNVGGDNPRLAFDCFWPISMKYNNTTWRSWKSATFGNNSIEIGQVVRAQKMNWWLSFTKWKMAFDTTFTSISVFINLTEKCSALFSASFQSCVQRTNGSNVGVFILWRNIPTSAILCSCRRKNNHFQHV